MNEIKPFDFNGQAVRVVTIDGEPWFVLADLCRVLGLTRGASQVASRLDEGVRQPYPLPTPGGLQQVLIVSEPGMWDVILRSDAPNARPVQRWVTGDVLPSIRKTGQYGAVQQLSPRDLALLVIAEADRADRAERQIEADKPKVLFADSVATSHTDILVGDLAKILKGNGVEVGAIRLFEWLRRDGYLIRREGTDKNMPTQRAMELGLFRVKETAVTHSDGRITISKTPKVTGKGQTYFVNRYATRELVGA